MFEITTGRQCRECQCFPGQYHAPDCPAAIEGPKQEIAAPEAGAVIEIHHQDQDEAGALDPWTTPKAVSKPERREKTARGQPPREISGPP